MKYVVLILIISIMIFSYFIFLPKQCDIYCLGDKQGYVETIINGKKYKLVISDSEIEREVGLMNLNSLPSDYGMLFIFEDSDIRNFWMKNTLVPLTALFIDDEKKIVHIENMTIINSTTNIYSSKFPSKYVIEINYKPGSNSYILDDIITW